MLNSFGLLFCSLFPLLSFPLFLDGIGHFWVYVHHIFRKSFHSLMVSASDRRNFTSRARAILFRSPINRLRKLLMTSCFIMRGSWHALVTPPFMASITASNDSVRPWTITFWRRQPKRQHRSGAPELRLRKLHLLPLHCLQSNLKERYAFGLLVHNNPGEVIKTAPGRCGAFKRSSLCTASPQTSAMASLPLSMSRSWVTTCIFRKNIPVWCLLLQASS